MSSSADEWFALLIGAALLVEGLAMLVSRFRRSARPAGAPDLALTLVGTGILMTVTNAAHLRGWSTPGKNAVFFCTVPVALATLVFAGRSLRAQFAGRKQQDSETQAVP